MCGSGVSLDGGSGEFLCSSCWVGCFVSGWECSGCGDSDVGDFYVGGVVVFGDRRWWVYAVLGCIGLKVGCL